MELCLPAWKRRVDASGRDAAAVSGLEEEEALRRVRWSPVEAGQHPRSCAIVEVCVAIGGTNVEVVCNSTLSNVGVVEFTGTAPLSLWHATLGELFDRLVGPPGPFVALCLSTACDRPATTTSGAHHPTTQKTGLVYMHGKKGEGPSYTNQTPTHEYESKHHHRLPECSQGGEQHPVDDLAGSHVALNQQNAAPEVEPV